MNGVLLIDKPQGCTSHDVVDRIRDILKMKAVGHAGTLDPHATGLLVMLIGDGTKLSQFVILDKKTYEVTVLFGKRTDSGDITGKVVEEKTCDFLTEEQVVKASQNLVGTLELVVPAYSAVKVGGRKLYEYARKNEAIEVPTRRMQINSVTLKAFQGEIASFEIDCEKGTYVRSWVEKLGSDLGTLATVKELRRLKSGPFSVENALKLEDLAKTASDPTYLSNIMIKMQDVLAQWPLLKVIGRDQKLIQHGQIPKGVYSQLMSVNIAPGVRMVGDSGSLLALAVPDPKKGVRLAKVFVTH